MAAICIVLLLINAFSQIDRILPFILAEKIKADLSLTDTQMGLLTGLAFAVCYALLSLPLARAADRGSPRFVLVSCVLIWSVMTTLGGFAASFMFLALTRFGVAFGEAGAVPSGHALIVRKIGLERRGLAIGLFAMGIPLGTMVGFAAGGAIADLFGWRIVLMGAGAIGILIGLLTILVAGPTPPLPTTAARDEPFLRTSLDLLSSPAFRWLFTGTIFLGFAGAPFYAFSMPFLIRTFVERLVHRRRLPGCAGHSWHQFVRARPENTGPACCRGSTHSLGVAASATVFDAPESGSQQAMTNRTADAFLFFRAWLSAPLRVASITPSGRAPSSLMTAEISAETGTVIKLGPGTGVFTQALRHQGVAVENLGLIETGPDFATQLSLRFPSARTTQMDCLGSAPLRQSWLN
nr:MFS transporter [Rhizobium sophorae]